MKIVKGDAFTVTADRRDNSPADRQRRFRAAAGTEYRTRETTRMRSARAVALPHFIGVDSEGIGRGKNHRAVLLGVGEHQYLASNLVKGLQWEETFAFLYSCFEKNPKAAYVGFYLSYDFNGWLRSLPRDKAHLLLTSHGKATRQMKTGKGMGRRRMMWPVRCGAWEIDMLGFKRLSIRPRPLGCTCPEDGIKCEHDHAPWMHICDAGSFFQMPFAKVIDPVMWAQDPDGPICTKEEYDKVLFGKEHLRADQKAITPKHMEYNALENELLARVMLRLAKGFREIGVKLSKDEWYGPGASASKWLGNLGIVKNREHKEYVPDWFDAICRKSYFGGWFEIFSHGLILGKSYNYDINNAYPYAATKLPHLCGECTFRRGQGQPKGDGKNLLVQATVFGGNSRIGPVPFRDNQGAILRPSTAKGWYWLAEIRAADRAGLVDKVIYHEYVEFVPCEHAPPFTTIRDLYNKRLEVGKNSAKGLAIKLNNNSIYGKFAQSVGAAPFNNWFYASYITSHCRSQILDAIATHPGGAGSVLMVATDGICFDSPHDSLAVSKTLGEWDHTEYTDLALFKPGVYWHKEGKEALVKVKSRGVPKAAFETAVDWCELQFRIMLGTKQAPGSVILNTLIGDTADEYDVPVNLIQSIKGWPQFYVPVSFRMKSCIQALNDGQWDRAGTVQESMTLLQDSDPQSKRRKPFFNEEKNRIDTVVHSLPFGKVETKYYGEVKYPHGSIGYGYEGNAMDPILEVAEILRTTKPRHDIPAEESLEWHTVWEGKS